MLETLDQLDKSLFFFLNGLHQTWADTPMIWITKTKTWFPLYALIIGFLIYHFRKKVIYVLVAITLTITAADQFASHLIKPTVKRFRPCSNPEIAEKVYVLVNCSEYGFISSHAANTFALATFLFLLAGSHFPKYRLKVGLFFFTWAGIVSYSRIYVGVHYAGDLLCGALAGSFFAYLFLGLLRRFIA